MYKLRKKFAILFIVTALVVIENPIVNIPEAKAEIVFILVGGAAFSGLAYDWTLNNDLHSLREANCLEGAINTCGDMQLEYYLHGGGPRPTPESIATCAAATYCD